MFSDPVVSHMHYRKLCSCLYTLAAMSIAYRTGQATAICVSHRRITRKPHV